MTSVLTKPEPNDPVEGQPGHFSHSNWVKASVKALDAACESGAFGVPIGTIVAFSGALNIPANWKICDGTNGTPNLQGKFILGASATRPAGSAGGAETVVLTKDQMPQHNHGGAGTTGDDSPDHGHALPGYAVTLNGQLGTPYVFGATTDQVMGNSGSGSPTVRHQHSFTVHGDGGGAAHENMPPYWALVYIMRVS